MAPLKILEDLCQLTRSGLIVKGKDPIDDMIGPGLVCRIEIARLGRRLKWPDDHSCRIWAQMQRLAVQELGLMQRGPLDWSM